MKFLYLSLITALLVSTSYSADAEEKAYYLLNVITKSEDAAQCDSYIRINHLLFVSQIQEINRKFTSRKIEDALIVVDNNKFKQYVEHLNICALYFKYTTEINYFRESYSNLMLLLTFVEVAKETGRYSNMVEGIDEVIISNVQGILESTRIYKQSMGPAE